MKIKDFQELKKQSFLCKQKTFICNQENQKIFWILKSKGFFDLKNAVFCFFHKIAPPGFEPGSSGPEPEVPSLFLN